MSEGADVNKTDGSLEGSICHYWYFLETNFKFRSDVCNSCHDLIQKAMSFNDVATISAKGSDYRTHFWYMSKYETINLLRNADLTEKSETL